MSLVKLRGGRRMIDFFYWPTPNGWKVAIMLEECGLEYRVIPVNIGRGDQFKPEFLAISPNNRMPAIIDQDAPREFGDGPLPVFESGAILIHLAERTGRFVPQSKRGRKECLEWLFWQVGNLGPMAGQLSHFVNYAPDEHPYSHKRYADEYNRCLGVIERRLEGRAFILDDYSIADMASWPWVLIAKPLGQPLDDFPNVARWRETIKPRTVAQAEIVCGVCLLRGNDPAAEPLSRGRATRKRDRTDGSVNGNQCRPHVVCEAAVHSCNRSLQLCSECALARQDLTLGKVFLRKSWIGQQQAHRARNDQTSDVHISPHLKAAPLKPTVSPVMCRSLRYVDWPHDEIEQPTRDRMPCPAVDEILTL